MTLISFKKRGARGAPPGQTPARHRSSAGESIKKDAALRRQMRYR